MTQTRIEYNVFYERNHDERMNCFETLKDAKNRVRELRSKFNIEKTDCPVTNVRIIKCTIKNQELKA